MPAIDELLDYIFDGMYPALYAEFAEWVRESRRFKEFAIHYRSKIRAKLKGVRDEEGLKEVRAELATAALLLCEKRFTLEYEKYAAAKQRGPDLTVTFKTHTPFNVEVRRIRPLEVEDADPEARMGKLMAVLCEKIRQMPPSIINFVWLYSEYAITEDDLTHATISLRQLAERKNEEYFTRRGFKNTADFLKHYAQMSGIILHQPAGKVIWLNPQARHKPPHDIVLAIQRLESY